MAFSRITTILARTGQNLDETTLNPDNVNSTTFGKHYSRGPVDGQVYAQPLYVANMAIPGQGIHNVVYVVTENDTVYAFDADAQRPPLWQTSLLINGGDGRFPIRSLPLPLTLAPLIGRDRDACD